MLRNFQCSPYRNPYYLRARACKRIEQHSLDLTALLLQGLGGDGANADVALRAASRCRCHLRSKSHNP